MSRKSFAVGTGAMALSPLVDIVRRDQRLFSPDSLFGSDRTYAAHQVRHSKHSPPPAGASEVSELLAFSARGLNAEFSLRCQRRIIFSSGTLDISVGKFQSGGNLWEFTKQ